PRHRGKRLDRRLSQRGFAPHPRAPARHRHRPNHHQHRPGMGSRARRVSARSGVSSADYLLGVNYWPARKFVRMWSQFDPREVAEDFARIESLGLRLVRIFVFWPDFQPEPDRVDEAQLENLRAGFELAWEQHLLLIPAALV